MTSKTIINSEKGLKSPLLSQAVIHSGTVYVSGNIGADYGEMKLAGEPNDIYAQTVSFGMAGLISRSLADLVHVLDPSAEEHHGRA